MLKFARDVREYLHHQGHVLLREKEPPRLVQVERFSTAMIATLTFAECTRRVVVKSMLRSQVESPKKLLTIHAAMRRHAELQQHTPAFLEGEAAHQWIFMEYVGGPTLLTVLKRALLIPRWGRQDCEAILEETGRIMALFHDIPAAEVGLENPQRVNESYLPSFDELWQSLASRRCRQASGFGSPQAYCDCLGAAFPRQVHASLLPIDAQPKNILVPESRSICFIDVDYTAGNPALNLAQFLVNMDRLVLRLPMILPDARVAIWKKAFLTAYFRKAVASIARDLLFFYPRALLIALRDHARERPFLHPYLAWFYLRRFKRLLKNVAGSQQQVSLASPCGEIRPAQVASIIQLLAS